MTLLSSFSAGLVLLNMVSLPFPAPGTFPQTFSFPEKNTEFRFQRKSLETNPEISKIIAGFQTAQSFLRSA